MWAALGLIACTAQPAEPGTAADLKEEERGLISSLFHKLVDKVVELAQADRDVPVMEPHPNPPVGEDLAIDEMFEIFDLEEVVPDEEMDIDGAMAAWYEPLDAEEDGFCYFTRSPGYDPAPETMFMNEFYGFRSFSGMVDQDRVIYYVNGVRTDEDAHCDTLQRIADATCGVVVGVYNATEGPLKDFAQTAFDRFTAELHDTFLGSAVAKLTKVHDNKAALLLQNIIVRKARLGQRIEIWAHSQGGAVTALALQWAIPILEREGLSPKGIHVVTFGAAAPLWIDKFPVGPNYEHYVHVRDLTPSMLGVGPWGSFVTFNGKTRAGEGATVHYFDGEPVEEDSGDAPSFAFFADHESVAIGFGDMRPEKYHLTGDTYIPAYEQHHGVCPGLDPDAEYEETWDYARWSNPAE